VLLYYHTKVVNFKKLQKLHKTSKYLGHFHKCPFIFEGQKKAVVDKTEKSWKKAVTGQSQRFCPESLQVFQKWTFFFSEKCPFSKKFCQAQQKKNKPNHKIKIY